MPRTLRGANNPVSAALRRREDGKARSKTQGNEEDQETQDSQALQEATVKNLEASALAELKKPALVEKAASLGLSIGGTKVELIARITEVIS